MNKKVIILFLLLFFIISAVYAEDNDNIENNNLSELSTNLESNHEDILVENNEINENNNIQNEKINLKNNTESNKESNEPIIDDEDNNGSLTPQKSASNVEPKVTVHNITEIRENKLNITMTSNVDGKIYYTRNGSMPTSKSLLYKNGEVLTICVKTQINAIVITNNNIISNITHYQSEQIITPPISIVKCLTDLVNDKQIINFTTNWNNTTTYYTLDGSNPKKSNTKVTYNNKSVTVNKNQTLKFYTKDNLEGYESIVYSYNMPKYYNERATLKVINTTRMYSDNHQKIMIQSNQPTVIEYYSYWGKNKVVHKKFTNEIETTKNTQLIIKSKH